MQYWRCKCGKAMSWGSMPPPRCMACDECGVTLATRPDYHHEPEPHKLVTEEVDTDDGSKPLTRCQWCFKTKAAIAKQIVRSVADSLPDEDKT